MVQGSMPACFKTDFSNTRVILDCKEFRIETPKAVDFRILTWSHYKKEFTGKLLVGTIPGGFICFKSLLSGGRKSDSQLITESGLLDLLEEDDLVLADEGFPEIVTELNEKGKILIMPPFLKTRNIFQKKQ